MSSAHLIASFRAMLGVGTPAAEIGRMIETLDAVQQVA
jgi:hypothetical protein